MTMTNTTPTDSQDWLDDPKVLSALESLSIQKNVEGKWFADDWRYDVTPTMEDLKAAITAHLQAAEKKGWSDGYHAGWNAYNESPYNPHEAKLTRLGKDSV